MDECIKWNGKHRQSDGRPVTDDKQYAYRYLWELEYGPLDSDLMLHHKCENSWCVNLDHLEPMTQSQHMKEHGFINGDWGQKDKTHCPQNHEYSEENTYVFTTKEGYVERHCRTCRKAAKKKYNAKLKAAKL
jgi:hypothetical protein